MRPPAVARGTLRRRAATPALVDDRSIIASSLSLRPVKTALQELADGSAPIFVGPWIDSVANELIYWIPFVRWACAAYGLSPERLIAVSRGGVRQWYAPVARRYVDTASLFSPSEHEQWQRRTIPQSEQNPNTQQQSVQRTHALDFARGKAKVTVAPDRCALIQDGADRYLVSGSGHSWLGQRPPEGVDYQVFSMLRR